MRCLCIFILAFVWYLHNDLKQALKEARQEQGNKATDAGQTRAKGQARATGTQQLKQQIERVKGFNRKLARRQQRQAYSVQIVGLHE